MMNIYEKQIIKIAEQLTGYDAGALIEFLNYYDKTNFEILFEIIREGVRDKMITSQKDLVTVILILSDAGKIMTKHPNQLFRAELIARLLSTTIDQINLFFKEFGMIDNDGNITDKGKEKMYRMPETFERSQLN